MFHIRYAIRIVPPPIEVRQLIGFPRQADKCDSSIIGTHPLVPFFFFKWEPPHVCQSPGTVPDSHAMLDKCVNLKIPTSSRAFSFSGQNFLGLPPQQASTTFQPQPAATISAMEDFNSAHSESMLPAVPGSKEKLLWTCGVENIPDRILCQMFPVNLRYLGFPGLSGGLPCYIIQLTTRWWSVDSPATLFTRVSRT